MHLWEEYNKEHARSQQIKMGCINLYDFFGF